MENWTGYIELDYDGSVVRCEILWDAIAADDSEFGNLPGIWINDELADSVDSREHFVQYFGSRFFYSMAAYKADRVLTIDDVWPLTK
jgi:hypothetical protein